MSRDVGKWKIRNADVIDALADVPDDTFHGVLCDPPYGLNFMGKGWDYGIPGSEYWKEILRVCKPGAHLLAFGGTRTFHRLVCAVEDAGWEIRDTIAWVYGSGFPKSHDVSKGIDDHFFGLWLDEHPVEKATLAATKKGSDKRKELKRQLCKEAGAEREVVGVNPNTRAGVAGHKTQYVGGEVPDREAYITAPATEAAQTWNGYGTALKPAFEPITVARKPFKGTVAANCLEHGAGALNVDGCRVEGVPPSVPQPKLGDAQRTYGHGTGEGRSGEMSQSTQGRWPANLIHDGSEEVLGLFPETVPTSYVSKGSNKGLFGMPGEKTSCYEDIDYSAARFFYCAKASRGERNAGCEGLVKKPMQWSSGEQSPGTFQADGTEKEARNAHPTVKPLALCKYLATLILPPQDCAPRKLLVPFSGSGSEMIGGLLAGWDRVMGFENDVKLGYIDIAKARLDWWLKRMKRYGTQLDLEEVRPEMKITEKKKGFGL